MQIGGVRKNLTIIRRLHHLADRRSQAYELDEITEIDFNNRVLINQEATLRIVITSYSIHYTKLYE